MPGLESERKPPPRLKLEGYLPSGKLENNASSDSSFMSFMAGQILHPNGGEVINA